MIRILKNLRKNMLIHNLQPMEDPEIKKPEKKHFWPNIKKGKTSNTIILSILVSSFFGLLFGVAGGFYFYLEIKDSLNKINIELANCQTVKKDADTVVLPIHSASREEEIVKVVKDISPTVVSIIVTKDLPVFEYYVDPLDPFSGGWPFYTLPQQRQKGTERKEIGGGTGFIVSSGGLVVTNKHVVSDEDAEYTVLTNDGSKFSAEVLARDPIQDLAILKIDGGGTSFPTVEFGDSSGIQIGQTVIAIGNALGEFRNTVSVGVISGLGRTITASGGGIMETMEDVIQTDAAINKGNSGGPLLNLKGEVIGINTATVLGAQSIGFAIPADKAKKDIKQVKAGGKIVYPFLGIRYILITATLQENHSLPVDYGALITKRDELGEVAIVPDSAADKAGLKENDIILEFDGQKINLDNSLAKLIQRKEPDDKILLKVLRDDEEMIISAVLGEKSE